MVKEQRLLVEIDSLYEPSFPFSESLEMQAHVEDGPATVTIEAQSAASPAPAHHNIESALEEAELTAERKWSCRSCTFLNDYIEERCGMCGRMASKRTRESANASQSLALQAAESENSQLRAEDVRLPVPASVGTEESRVAPFVHQDIPGLIRTDVDDTEHGAALHRRARALRKKLVAIAKLEHRLKSGQTELLAEEASKLETKDETTKE